MHSRPSPSAPLPGSTGFGGASAVAAFGAAPVRVTTSAVELGGHEIDEGQFVLTCLASANRDPAKWGPTAAELDRADLVIALAREHVAWMRRVHPDTAPRTATRWFSKH